MFIGYARTSTVDQVAGLEAQEAALAATRCSKVFREQASSVGQRGQLDAALDFVREGDTLVVTRLDRLARSTADLLGIVAMLERQRVGVARARAEGKYRGRAPTARHKSGRVMTLHAEGRGAAAIAAEVGNEPLERAMI